MKTGEAAAYDADRWLEFYRECFTEIIQLNSVSSFAKTTLGFFYERFLRLSQRGISTSSLRPVWASDAWSLTMTAMSTLQTKVACWLRRETDNSAWGIC